MNGQGQALDPVLLAAGDVLDLELGVEIRSCNARARVGGDGRTLHPEIVDPHAGDVALKCGSRVALGTDVGKNGRAVAVHLGDGDRAASEACDPADVTKAAAVGF